MLKHGKKASDKQSIVQFFLQPELGNYFACIKGSLSSSKEHLDRHLFFAADSLPWLVWNISSKSVSANEVLWSIISGLALWYIWIWKSRNARVFGNNNHIPADCIVSVIRGLAVDSWKNKSEDMCRGAFRSRSTKWGGNSLLKMG